MCKRQYNLALISSHFSAFYSSSPPATHTQPPDVDQPHQPHLEKRKCLPEFTHTPPRLNHVLPRPCTVWQHQLLYQYYQIHYPCRLFPPLLRSILRYPTFNDHKPLYYHSYHPHQLYRQCLVLQAHPLNTAMDGRCYPQRSCNFSCHILRRHMSRLSQSPRKKSGQWGNEIKARRMSRRCDGPLPFCMHFRWDDANPLKIWSENLEALPNSYIYILTFWKNFPRVPALWLATPIWKSRICSF